MTRAPDHLHAALRAQAKGLYACEAATELLIMHALWLHRTDFIKGFVHTGTGLISGIPMSAVDWPEAITGAGSRTSSLLGRGGSHAEDHREPGRRIPVNLRDALTGLDSTNINLVASAVLHTGGQK